MTYFLDFDRTLFDTDAYNLSLIDEPGCAPFKDELIEVLAEGRDETRTGSVARTAAWEKVSAAMRSGALTFTPGHLERFLYADVAEFLRSLGNEAIIITYGEVERQRMKVQSALASVTRVTVLYTDTASKVDFLSSWPGYSGGDAIFVDDMPVELEEISVQFPSMRLYEMRRNGNRGDGRWPVVRSLHELP